jgi:hypothetical protein
MAFADAIINFVHAYLDAMPSRSRIPLYDLVDLTETKVGSKLPMVGSLVRATVKGRADILILRGIGAVKR